MTRHTKSQPLVYIIVPTFNQKELVLRFVESLRRQTYPNFQLVIVDDASKDGTQEALTAYPEVVVLKGSGDLWWSGATNKGVRYAQKKKADFILTINHDVTLEKNYLTTLVVCAIEHPDSLIGSLVIDRTDRDDVWFAGGTYNSWRGLNEHVTGNKASFIEPRQSTWLTGMGVLVPTHVFNVVGYYDDKHFPLYFGDADFSERARRAGFTLWVDPKSRVYGDIHENWVGRNLKRPKIRFIYDLFTLINSPFQWKTRRLYYQRYWPGNYRRALFHFYTIGSATVYRAYCIGLIKRLLGRGERT